MNDMNGYAAVPSWMIADERISGPAVLVYAALASRAGFKSIHPGQALLAKEARCSERRVRDALNELEALGVIDRVKRRFGSGARASDGYVLLSGTRPSQLAEQPAADAGGVNLPAAKVPPTGRIEQIVPLIEITTREITTSTRESAMGAGYLDSVYEEFRANWKAVGVWQAGPKVKVKLDQLVKAGKLPEIEAGLRRLAADPNRPEANFVPRPLTWLNQSRWEDDPYPAPAGRQGAAAQALSVDLGQSPVDGGCVSQIGVFGEPGFTNQELLEIEAVEAQAYWSQHGGQR